MKFKTYIKVLQWMTLLLFGGIISLPLVNGYFHFVDEKECKENRTKISKPVFDNNSASWDAYLKQYDDYFTDNFSLRNNFISIHNQFEYLLYGVSPSPDNVILGKKSWFYNTNCIPTYSGLEKFSEQELEKIKNELTKRSLWASSKGIKYYLALVPNKMNVYPEYLPPSIIKHGNESKYDQLVSLNEAPNVNIINLKTSLLQHKSNSAYPLYQSTDDHWNDLGAYYGYEAIMQRLAKDYPTLNPIEINNYSIAEENREGNMALMLNLEKICPEKYIALTPKKKSNVLDGKKRGYKVPSTVSEWDYEMVKVNKNGTNLKCLIIRDSYTLQMVKFFQEHFKETVFIHGEWKYALPEEIVLKEKPDIIITIMVETYLNRLLEFPFYSKENIKKEKTVNIKAANNLFLCSDSDNIIRANRKSAYAWESFLIQELKNGEFVLLNYEFQKLINDSDLNNVMKVKLPYKNGEEIFSIIQLKNNKIALKTKTGKFLSLNHNLTISASSDTIGKNENFELIIK